jgi:hypothetical protein
MRLPVAEEKPPAGKSSLGRTVTTPGALAAVPVGEVQTAEVQTALRRHHSGDWDDLCDEDRTENERSLREGFRLALRVSRELWSQILRRYGARSLGDDGLVARGVLKPMRCFPETESSPCFFSRQGAPDLMAQPGHFSESSRKKNVVRHALKLVPALFKSKFTNPKSCLSNASNEHVSVSRAKRAFPERSKRENRLRLRPNLPRPGRGFSEVTFVTTSQCWSVSLPKFTSAEQAERRTRHHAWAPPTLDQIRAIR